MGETIESEDNDGNVVYSVYCPDGKLKETYTSINPSAKITFTYDEQGNRETISDPDAGTITTVYDAFGNLVMQINAKGDTTIFEYDDLNRLTESEDVRGKISYEYYSDTTKQSFGKIHTISNSAQTLTEEFTYDNNTGQLLKFSKEVDSRLFTFSFLYDWFGRPYSKQYPSGFSIIYGYNNYGDLKSISANGKQVWSCSSINEFGQITAYTQGNYNSQIEYDQFGILEGISTGNVFDMDYDFDDLGNLSYREDNITNQREDFTYDALNRLTDISYELNGVPQTSWEYHIEYSDGGNIISKTDAAEFIGYGEAANAGPHAVTSMNNITNSWDPVDQSISYNCFNKVDTISQLDQNNDPIELSFLYGLDNQRIKTVFKRDGNTEKTKYFLGEYEEVTTASGTKKYHFISGGNGLCGIFNSDVQ